MQQLLPTSARQKLAIARNFSKAASTYDQAAIIQQEVGQRLLERLELIKLSPTTILDLGSGTGFFSQALSKKYPDAIVLNTDISEGMINFAKQVRHSPKQFHLCADGDYLPIKSHSIDFFFSNCALSWFFLPRTVFKEIRRLLKPEGLLLFSTFGPDTLQELKACFNMLDDKEHINPFIDMHDIGDMLLQEGLLGPVMDMEHITLAYKDIQTLINDLKLTGARFVNNLPSNSRGLFTPRYFQKLLSLYARHFQDADQKFSATFEVIYGHAWAGQSPIPESRKIAFTLEDEI